MRKFLRAFAVTVCVCLCVSILTVGTQMVTARTEYAESGIYAATAGQKVVDKLRTSRIFVAISGKWHPIRLLEKSYFYLENKVQLLVRQVVALCTKIKLHIYAL